MKRYIKDGKVGVVISPKYGGGFSSWGDPLMATDPQIVEWVHNMEKHEEHTAEYHHLQDRIYHYLNTHYPNHSYHGDWLTVVWLDPGTRFIVHEYDGSESVWTEHSMNWSVA